jgi:Ca2+/Na+ antiporter
MYVYTYIVFLVAAVKLPNRKEETRKHHRDHLIENQQKKRRTVCGILKGIILLTKKKFWGNAKGIKAGGT